MLPGSATLKVLVRPPVGLYTAVGLEVSMASPITWPGVSGPRLRFYIFISIEYTALTHSPEGNRQPWPSASLHRQALELFFVVSIEREGRRKINYDVPMESLIERSDWLGMLPGYSAYSAYSSVDPHLSLSESIHRYKLIQNTWKTGHSTLSTTIDKICRMREVR